jgi:D-alanine-D-alanine ligase
MARRLRVLALVHDYLMPPEDVSGVNLETAEWKMEYDVLSTLRQMGHELLPLGIKDTLVPINEALERFKPHIAFNLMENLREVASFDQNVVSFLEVLRVAYTGCNPRGMMLSRDKAISKTLLAYHNVPVPEFAVYPVGRTVQRPKRLRFPLMVKSLTADASEGISQASVVADEGKLQERVRFIHEKLGTDALVERYIPGRELYVGVLGNERLTILPVWELHLSKMPEAAYHIATERVKWNKGFQEKHGIEAGPAQNLPDDVVRRIRRICSRVYRTLQLNGYARIDLRLDAEGHVYVLEANANPQLAIGEDFAESAKHAGLAYPQLLQRIMALGLSWRPELRG